MPMTSETADLTAAYALTERVDVRLNVFNVNNAYYFDRLGGGHRDDGGEGCRWRLS